MSNDHSLTDNVVYNMISVQYHALKAGNVYEGYLEDCHGHQDVAAFILQCQAEDAARVQRAHDLIKSLMQGDADAAPADASSDAAPAEEAPAEEAPVAAPVAAYTGGRSKVPAGEKVRRWR